MSRYLAGSLLWIFLILPARAADAPGRVLSEDWLESRAAKGKIGYLHFLAKEMDSKGRKLIHTTITEEIRYVRSGDPYHEKQETYTVETESGEVVELGYITNLSKKQVLSVRGIVEGPHLTFRVYNGGTPTQFTQKIKWDKSTLGLYALDRYFKGKKLVPGQKLVVREFSTSANETVPTTYTIQGWEETPVSGKPRRLLRVEQSYPRELFIARSWQWLDESGNAVKMEEDTPIFGMVTYEQTTKEVALAPFAAQVNDSESTIKVTPPLRVKPRPPKELLVHVTHSDDDDPGTLFARDGRQIVVKSDTKAVEIRLLAKPVEDVQAKLTPPGAEYLESNLFIRSDDALVQKYAKEAVGGETDPRRQTRLIRRWIRAHVKGDYEVPFATADEVARTLEGDCSEMGVLCAAMCRSLGIPARIVFGFVYDSETKGFDGHLWSEVYLDKGWERCDATGVTDKSGAAYIKVADYSLHNIINPDTLPEVRRAFGGKMKIEVVESK